MKGKINIKYLNTIREVELCLTLGYVIINHGWEIRNSCELFTSYRKLKEDLEKETRGDDRELIISAIRELSAFFYRHHISEEGGKEEQQQIRKLNLQNDYWTEI